MLLYYDGHLLSLWQESMGSPGQPTLSPTTPGRSNVGLKGLGIPMQDWTPQALASPAHFSGNRENGATQTTSQLIGSLSSGTVYCTSVPVFSTSGVSSCPFINP